MLIHQVEVITSVLVMCLWVIFIKLTEKHTTSLKLSAVSLLESYYTYESPVKEPVTIISP